MTTLNTWDVCKNCGAERGLHHYQTMQCPVGGREAPISQTQEYMTTTFEVEDDTKERVIALEAKIEELEEKVSRLIEAVPSAGERV